MVASHNRVRRMTSVIGLLMLLPWTVWLSPASALPSFERGGIACTRNEDGSRGCGSTYRFTDGETVGILREERWTPESAKGQLEFLASKAVRIIERRSGAFDGDTLREDRVVAIFPKGVAAIFWREGTKLNVVQSNSLKHAYLMEHYFFAPRD